MCAFHNEIKNCAYCAKFPCEDSPKFDIEKLEKRLKGLIPQEDYCLYVGPWTSSAILQKIRINLTPEEIKEIKPVNVDLKIVEFPEELKLEEEEKKAYLSLHKLITNVEPLSNLSYARAETLKEVRKYYIRLLWAFGINGEYKKENNSKFLLLNSEAYFAEMKKTRYYSNSKIVQKRFQHLEKFGIKLEIVPEKSLEDIITPMKGIRKTGWSLRMSFNKNIQEGIGLKALKNYTKKLHEKFSTRGYTRFSRADMNILGGI